MPGLISLAVLLFLLGLLLYRLHYPKHYRTLNKLNGPRLMPVLGMCLDLMSFDCLGVTNYILETDKQFESPVRYKVMSTYIIHLFRASHVEKLMRSKVNIRKGDVYNLLHCWLGSEGLLTAAGDSWEKQRRTLTPAFHTTVLRQFKGIMQKNADVLVDHIRERLADGQSRLDVHKLMNLTTLDVVCETAMGKQLNSLRQGKCDYARCIQEFGELLTYRLLRPWAWSDTLFFNLHPKGWQLKRNLKIMHEFTATVIDERRKARKRKALQQRDEDESDVDSNGLPSKNRLIFLDLLLEMQERGDLSEEEVKSQVDTFMFAGHDTTGATLMWTVYCLATNPEAQQRCQAEVDAVFEDAEPTEDDGPTSEQLSRLDYVERCIKETQRLYPTVAVFSRETDEPLDLGDGSAVIPAGVLVEVWTTRLHRDPDQFPRPDVFDADRFLPAETARRHPFAYLPFAAGPRNCIGQKFALLEMKIILASVLRRFTVTCRQTPAELQPAINLIYQPSVPVMVHFTER